MVGADGLGRLSMDELADRAGVSRATLYRLVPGKAGLLTDLIAAYSPLETLRRLLSYRHEAPPAERWPGVALNAYSVGDYDAVHRYGVTYAIYRHVSSS